MPELTEAELEERVMSWLELCGSCDGGLTMDCTCPTGDVRLVLLDLWRAYQQAPVAATTPSTPSSRHIDRHLGLDT